MRKLWLPLFILVLATSGFGQVTQPFRGSIDNFTLRARYGAGWTGYPYSLTVGGLTKLRWDESGNLACGTVTSNGVVLAPGVNRAVDLSDWPVGLSTVELGYLSTATSDVQTQLDAKAAKPTRIITVSPAGQSGQYATIKAASAAITDAGVDKPYTIQLYPGAYTVDGTEPKEYVNIVGPRTAVITLGQMYVVSSNSEIRGVTVNTGVFDFIVDGSARVVDCHISPGTSRAWAIQGSLVGGAIIGNVLDGVNPLYLAGCDGAIIANNVTNYTTAEAIAEGDCVAWLDMAGPCRNTTITGNSVRICATNAGLDSYQYGFSLGDGYGNTVANNRIEVIGSRKQSRGIVYYAADSNYWAGDHSGEFNRIENNTILVKSLHTHPTDSNNLWLGAGTVKAPAKLYMRGNLISTDSDAPYEGTRYSLNYTDTDGTHALPVIQTDMESIGYLDTALTFQPTNAPGTIAPVWLDQYPAMTHDHSDTTGQSRLAAKDRVWQLIIPLTGSIASTTHRFAGGDKLGAMVGMSVPGDMHIISIELYARLASTDAAGILSASVYQVSDIATSEFATITISPEITGGAAGWYCNRTTYTAATGAWDGDYRISAYIWRSAGSAAWADVNLVIRATID